MKRYRILGISAFFVLLLALILFAPVGQETEQDYRSRELQASREIQAQLQSLRAQIKEKNYTFSVGYTTAMDYKIEQITGLVEPPNLKELMQKKKIEAENLISSSLKEKVEGGCSASSTTFDWRKQDGATPVRNQKGCGSCWAFSTLGAFEGSYRIINNCAIDSAEQDLLDCNPSGYSCGGGWWSFQYVINTGVARESDYPYQAVKGTCNSSVQRPYKALSWGYVGSALIPSITEIKNALCQYGPLAIAVQVTPQFQAYTGGVYNACANFWQGSTNYAVNDLIMPTGSDIIYICIAAGTTNPTEPVWPPLPQPGDPPPTVIDGTVVWRYSGRVNHGVTLIGWDDSKSAWLIKNSWGTTWGETCGFGTENGFMWISYNCNNIGLGAAWVQAKEKTGCCN